jgi:Flp pilus assembly protein TadD
MGRWQEAEADFARLVELEPDNDEYYHALAPLLVQKGDLNGYRLSCGQALARFGRTSDPNTAERTAKDSLILSDSGVDLNAVNALADIAVTAGKDSRDLPWFEFCKALAEYRQGHFAGAVDWAQKALCHTGDQHNCDVEAYMVLAMAQYRCNQAELASVAFGKGVEIAESKLPKLESHDLGEAWVDWLIAHALMCEGRALMGGAKATDQQ